jgi:hypothetical protein
MEPFEIKELLTVKGKPGLWRMIKFISAGKPMVRVKNLIDETETTVKLGDVAAIKNFQIFLTDGKKMTLEAVFDAMMILAERNELPDLDGFEKLSPEDKTKVMRLIIPTHDDEQFKHYHMAKIIKWYKDLDKALDILNADNEDPYLINDGTDGSKGMEAKTIYTNEDFTEPYKPIDV